MLAEAEFGAVGVLLELEQHVGADAGGEGLALQRSARGASSLVGLRGGLSLGLAGWLFGHGRDGFTVIFPLRERRLR